MTLMCLRSECYSCFCVFINPYIKVRTSLWSHITSCGVNKLHMDINSFCTARHFCEMRIFSYYFPLKFLSFFCTSHFTSSDKRDSKFCVSAFHAASVIECWYKIYVMLSLRLALDLVRAVSFTSTCICHVRYRVTDILSRLANHITCCLYDPVLILFLMTSFLIVFLSLIWLFSCILLP